MRTTDLTLPNLHSETFGDPSKMLDVFLERSEMISKEEQPKRSKLVDQMTYKDLRLLVEFVDKLESLSDEMICDVHDELSNQFGIHSISDFINECRDLYLESETQKIERFIDSRTFEEIKEVYDHSEGITDRLSDVEEIEEHRQWMTDEFGIHRWGLFEVICEERFPKIRHPTEGID
ncbi:MAG: hypothetical protein VW270_14835 [Candidatus Poseidoniales archaeon]